MPKSNTTTLLIFCILLLSINLRAPFTSLAPLIAQIMDSLQISAVSMGIITSTPLIMFALASPFCPKLGSKLGLEKSICFALVLIGLGVVCRSFGHFHWLFIGTILIGLGIAIGNVLAPAVIKSSFPGRIATITALYGISMGVGSTLSSSIMVPVSSMADDLAIGWRIALAGNLIFPCIALIFWLPRLTESKTRNETRNREYYPLSKLMRQPLAWFFTFALGLNSFTFYTFSGWLPKILAALGYSELDAGYVYGFLQFSTIVPGLLLIPIMKRTQTIPVLFVGAALLNGVGVAGLMMAPGWAIFWVALFGLGNCSTFILALSILGQISVTSTQAATLSGMAQSIGYTLAALGPAIIGMVYSQTETWSLPLAIITVVAFLCAIFAFLTTRKGSLTVD
ncbi:MFS transporter [Vibrio sp.]|nr:MFS transporter [Vibrio sp.]